jgi:hypothetical protein
MVMWRPTINQNCYMTFYVSPTLWSQNFPIPILRQWMFSYTTVLSSFKITLFKLVSVKFIYKAFPLVSVLSPTNSASQTPGLKAVFVFMRWEFGCFPAVLSILDLSRYDSGTSWVTYAGCYKFDSGRICRNYYSVLYVVHFVSPCSCRQGLNILILFRNAPLPLTPKLLVVNILTFYFNNQ